MALDGVTIAGINAFGTEDQTRFTVVARLPGPSAGTSAGSGGGGPPRTMPRWGMWIWMWTCLLSRGSRLLGIIDWSLLSIVDDKR